MAKDIKQKKKISQAAIAQNVKLASKKKKEKNVSESIGKTNKFSSPRYIKFCQKAYGHCKIKGFLLLLALCPTNRKQHKGERAQMKSILSVSYFFFFFCWQYCFLFRRAPEISFRRALFLHPEYSYCYSKLYHNPNIREVFSVWKIKKAG